MAALPRRQATIIHRSSNGRTTLLFPVIYSAVDNARVELSMYNVYIKIEPIYIGTYVCLPHAVALAISFFNEMLNKYIAFTKRLQRAGRRR